jgi:hypothetical protein
MDQNVMAVRILVAKLSGDKLNRADMGELVCPYNGRPCVGENRQAEHREASHGTDDGGVEAAAKNMGPP